MNVYTPAVTMPMHDHIASQFASNSVTGAILLTVSPNLQADERQPQKKFTTQVIEILLLFGTNRHAILNT